MGLTPGTRLGVYEVIAPIGEGGMGQVLRARDTKLDRDVAIKILLDAGLIESSEHRRHLQLNMAPELLISLEDVLLRLPTPLVFDHFGRVPQPDGIKHQAYRTIRTLLDKGQTWVKMSAPYSTSKVAPPYADVANVAKDLVRVAPERLVWASDWPHPTATERPNDAVLFDLLSEWAPDEAVRNRILVQNPEVLYRFPASGELR